MSSGEGSSPDKFNLAKKMLAGIGKKPSDAPRQPEPEAGGQEPDLLAKLVGAMKDVSAPGPTGVEPDGYGYLAAVRAGEGLGEWSKWEAIEALQRILPKAGYPLQVTGRWDAQTTAAVKRFQKEKGVSPVTGVFDAATLAALDKVLGLDAPAAAPRSGAPRSSAPGLPPSGNDFIDGLAMGAVKGMLEAGVPASVSIAMAVIESGWGEGELARRYHNLFAMKGTGPEGSVMLAEGDEGNLVASANGENYKVYRDDAQCVADFARSFAGSDPYQGVMQHKNRPDNFARALSGVFSPNPNYGSTLLRIMKQYDLYRFDAVRSL